MNVKNLVTIVGALSLTSLVAGCATTQPTKPAATQEQGAQHSCGAGACGGAKPADSTAKPADSSGKPAQTPEKGGQGSCGSGSCGGGK